MNTSPSTGIGADDTVQHLVRSWLAADADLLWIVPGRNLLLKHPKDIRAVLNDPRYTKETGANRYFRSNVADGVLTAPSPRHHTERRVLHAAVRDPLRLEQVATKHITALIAKWQRHAMLGERVDLTAAMSEWTFGVIAEVLFGWTEIEVLATEMRAAMTVLDASGVMLPPPEQLAPVRDRVLHVIADMIARQPPTERGPALRALCEAGYGQDAVAAQVLTLLLAGHETTATSLAWTWICLMRTPQVYARWQRRMRAAPRLARALTGTITREGLRLYPASWVIGRTASIDTHLGGIDIPAGCTITISPFVTHRHPAFWGPDPEAFRPERHEDKSVPGGAWLPFGVGPRMCLGLGYALTEMDIALSGLGQRFTFHSPDAESASPRWRFTLGAPAMPVGIEPLGARL
ncbi:cytochrome P450 [Nocardia miyunensis]|uniref:cytochrome P450 n=1 Tax=Nocardia miyunensis TaxID=282684 RepID=UPI0008347191|nr:cytochrome P450 [Nocardia miyunensis]